MATKTISIDMEAYRRLKEVQRDSESFSQVIKRVVPRPISTEELIRLFRTAGSRVSNAFVDAVEDVVAMQRGNARVRARDEERIHGVLGHHRADRSHRPRGTKKTRRGGASAKAA